MKQIIMMVTFKYVQSQSKPVHESFVKRTEFGEKYIMKETKSKIGYFIKT